MKPEVALPDLTKPFRVRLVTPRWRTNELKKDSCARPLFRWFPFDKVGHMNGDSTPTSGGPTYSFVIPVLNESCNLGELHDRLVQVLARLDGDSEVLLIDDGSTDDTWTMVCDLHRLDNRFKGVKLSRNFGKEVAVTAGMDLARGDAVVLMDADLQEPPETVLEMDARWRDGYEVV